MKGNELIVRIGTMGVIFAIVVFFVFNIQGHGTALAASVSTSLPAPATSSLATSSVLHNSLATVTSFLPLPARLWFQTEISSVLKVVATCFLVFMFMYLLLQRNS